MKNKHELFRLEEAMGYHFREQKLLKRALTHSSYANELRLNKLEDYERLEFLGDAVLELSVSEFLFENNDQMEEGKMTKLRASLVCEPALAMNAKKIDLSQYIFLGKGEELTGGRERDSIVSDVFEAVIGDIYLDGGFANAKEFVKKFVLDDMEQKRLFFDSKTILQERVQTEGKKATYELLAELGPDHNKEYVSAAMIDGIKYGEGRGKTKKGAEQQAAFESLLKLDKEEKQ